MSKIIRKSVFSEKWTINLIIDIISPVNVIFYSGTISVRSQTLILALNEFVVKDDLTLRLLLRN